MANYKQGNGKQEGSYMIDEAMSEPSNMPRSNKSIMYADVSCGGEMANDSVNYSDRNSDEMASKLKKQKISGKF